MKYLATALLVCTLSSIAGAQVYIQEFCSDPFGPTVGIDANADGAVATSGSQNNDEFVELVNGGLATVDLGGWTVSDAVSVRHTFAAGTCLAPGAAIVVFGGGSVTNFNTLGGGTGVVATTGMLGLNNGGDTITVKNAAGATIEAYTFGVGGAPDNGDGESVTRNPEVAGSAFAKHTLVTPGFFHSAGKMNDGVTNYAGATPPTPAYLGNASDCAIGVTVNGASDTTCDDRHIVAAGSSVAFAFRSPLGTLNNQSFIAVIDVFVTGMPPAAIALPGESPSIYLNPATATVLVDGFSNPFAIFSPVLLPGSGYVAGGLVPVGAGGLGLSVMVQLIANDPGHNLVNLGVSNAHEIIIP